MPTRQRFAPFAVLIVLTVAAAQASFADVGICLGNGTYKIYKTDKTCADFTIGPIIRKCTDLGIADPGGGGLGSAPTITDVHPLLDGQPLVGIVPFLGSAMATDGAALGEFVLTQPLSGAGETMELLGFDAGGNIYRATFPAAGTGTSALGGTVITGTPGGEDITLPLSITGRGTVATGDLTVTADVVDPADESVILETHHTSVVLADLVFEFFDAPVATSESSWGRVKVLYR